MNEEKYTLSFEIISMAGNAKSLAIMAAESARNNDFEQAEKYLAEAKDNMVEAHEFQTDMIRDEINGKGVECNILLIHAQDHLTMATMAIDNAKEFIEIYRMLHELRQENK